MSGPAELSVAAGVVIDAGLKATVVVGAGALLARALGNASAATRHGVWAVTLGALPVLPLMAWSRGPTVALDQPVVVGLWALGVLVAAWPMARGLLALARMPLEGTDRRGRVRIGLSDRTESPLTWGWWRPVVVLPEAARAWEPTLRDAALAHELAHVRRMDWVVHLLANGVGALFWFNPLVWWAVRQLALEAEHAADDAVLATGIAPSRYAELLVRLAVGRTPTGALGASSHLGLRVRAILDDRVRTPSRRLAVAVVGVLALASVPALGAFPTWSAPAATLTCDPGVQP